MTEQEWLTCADPRPMLEFLRGKASDRKLRLFACACCRRVSHLFASQRSRATLELAERYADEPASKKQILRAFQAAQADDPAPETADHAVVHALDPSALGAAYQTAHDASIQKAGGVQYRRVGGSFPKPPGWRSFEVRKPTVHALEEAAQANLLRCLIGSRVQHRWPSTAPGSLPRRKSWPKRSMKPEISTACQSWPMRWRRLVVTIAKSCGTAEEQGLTLVAAGSPTFSSTRSDLGESGDQAKFLWQCG